jgi:general secretion pathway protein D
MSHPAPRAGARRPLSAVLPALLALAGCAGDQRPVPIAAPPTPELVAQTDRDLAVRATVLGGEAPPPGAPRVPATPNEPGPLSANFPGADVGVVAKAVLGDLLHRDYAIAPGTSGQVSFVTPGGVSARTLLALFETALRNAGLALTPQGGGFLIQPVAAAQAAGPGAPDTIGYGTELVTLQFINADELRKLLESVLPGVVIATDPARNAITIAGTTGQRAGARDLIAQFDVNWLRNMSFAMFVPQRTDSRLITPELDKLINAPDAPTRGLVKLIQMEKLNGILAISPQRQYLEDVRRWIEVLDREGQNNEPRLFVYRVQNGRARDLTRTLNAAFGIGGSGDNGNAPDPLAVQTDLNTSNNAPRPAAPDQGPQARAPSQSGEPGSGPAGAAASGFTGRISADEVNNAVIIFGTPRDYAVVEDALRKLDVVPTQVMIEAAITEVALTDDLRFGVQWNFVTGNSNFTLGEGSTATLGRNLPGFSYYYGGNDIQAALSALEERTNLKVVSAPKLMVLNNQTAALQVGDQVPIQTQQVTGIENSNGTIANSIEYRDTGVILRVTPRVNAGGLVLLDIAQEVSDLSNTRITGINSPVISTRRVATSIAVMDNQVIALGGLFRNSQSFGKNGVPILSRIPVLGSLLFGRTDNVQRRTELIVLLKPHVVRSPDDGRAVTEELRAKLRTLEPFRTRGTIP